MVYYFYETFSAPVVKVNILKDSKGKDVRIATVIGILSWGIGCGNAEYPDVNGRVTSVLEWIEDTTGNF